MHQPFRVTHSRTWIAGSLGLLSVTAGLIAFACRERARYYDVVGHRIDQVVYSEARGSLEMDEELRQRTIRMLARIDDPNYRSPQGTTALMAAIELGETTRVAEFLSRGANPNAKGLHGLTALHIAASNGQPEVLDLLLRAGANPNQSGSRGNSPLTLASRHPDRACVEQLLAAGAVVNDEGKNGSTGLVMAATWNRLEVARLLLQHGANPDSSYWLDGRTALMCAVERKHMEMVRLLLATGADPLRSDCPDTLVEEHR